MAVTVAQAPELPAVVAELRRWDAVPALGTVLASAALGTPAPGLTTDAVLWCADLAGPLRSQAREPWQASPRDLNAVRTLDTLSALVRWTESLNLGAGSSPSAYPAGTVARVGDSEMSALARIGANYLRALKPVTAPRVDTGTALTTEPGTPVLDALKGVDARAVALARLLAAARGSAYAVQDPAVLLCLAEHLIGPRRALPASGWPLGLHSREVRRDPGRGVAIALSRLDPRALAGELFATATGRSADQLELPAEQRPRGPRQERNSAAEMRLAPAMYL